MSAWIKHTGQGELQPDDEAVAAPGLSVVQDAIGRRAAERLYSTGQGHERGRDAGHGQPVAEPRGGVRLSPTEPHEPKEPLDQRGHAPITSGSRSTGYVIAHAVPPILSHHRRRPGRRFASPALRITPYRSAVVAASSNPGLPASCNDQRRLELLKRGKGMYPAVVRGAHGSRAYRFAEADRYAYEPQHPIGSLWITARGWGRVS
jgi:hypothetical protein